MIFVQYQKEDMQIESYPRETKKDWVARDSEQLAPANTKRLPPLESAENEEPEELQFPNDGSDNDNSSSDVDYQDGDDEEDVAR